MCYEPSARPPFPPIAGGSSTGEVLTLTSADGTTFAAFESGAGETAIVILPDVRGLHAFYEDLALRFADVGTHAIAIDYFGRTAGATRRDDDFEFMPHVMQTTPQTVSQDAGAAAAYLRAAGATRVFTIGFCFGGRASFNEAASNNGHDGVIGFYGRVGKRDEYDDAAPVLHAASYRCPVLGLFGGADPAIPIEDVDAFKAALETAGVDNDIVVYDGAPHSFFDRFADSFADASDDAWRRILEFIR